MDHDSAGIFSEEVPSTGLTKLRSPEGQALSPWERLHRLASLEAGDLAAILIYAVAIGLASLAVPLAAQALVNSVAFSALAQPVVVLSILLLVGLLVAGGLRILQYRLAERLQQRFFVRATHDVIHRLVRADVDALSALKGREFMNRFFDVAIVQKTSSALLLDGLSIVLQGMASLVLLALYHPALLAFDVVLLGAIALILALGRTGVPTAIYESKAKYATVGWLQDLAERASALKEREAALRAFEKGDELARATVGARQKHFRILLRQMIASTFLQALATAGLLGLGGMLVMKGQLTMGQLVAAELAVAGVLSGVAKFGKHLEGYYDLAASIDKVGSLVDLPSDGQEGQERPTTRDAASHDLVRSTRGTRILARLLVGGAVLLGLTLVFTPWQQTAPGLGRVIAYAPEERRQNIEAPIEGRVLRWYVREGASVRKGDPIVDLTDNDPDIVMRLRSERDAIATRLDSARDRARSLESRIDSLADSRVSAGSAAESRTQMATQRVSASEQAVALANATLEIARINVERQKALAGKGLTSKRQLELTELEETRARTESERAKVALSAARSEALALSSDRQKVGTDATAAISDAKAAQSAAEAEVANASAELARVEVRLARQSAQSVVAPRDGSVLRIVANGHAGEVVKAGDMLAVLVPETAERAVEVWVSGNDTPLVREGAAARVQFEGWPALQFSGWPSVAVGSFPARVSLIDASDSDGLFRVVLVPEAGSEWPAAYTLRQGVRAQAWVQLGRVRLGYELWRQFNGFPPSLPADPSKAKKDLPGPKRSAK